uniref:Uncharacterized protein n=1 Tax=Hemiselmis andersenii TaxID=464988 RepID=A0A6T8PKV3_HEMAN|mmetsp:Transcript_7958/g.18424  ORF Transcript_7958/g.18424 Transcript_7958/m.18424 type:complete len:206 (+) Transcript_7958:40-657(+)
MGLNKPSVLPAVASTLAMAMLCVGLVASSLYAETQGMDSKADELMDWGSIKASQQLAEYRKAYELDGNPMDRPRGSTSGSEQMASKGARAEMRSIEHLNSQVLPTEHKARRVAGAGKRTSSQMLAHYQALNKEVFPKERLGKQVRQTAEQELSHLKALSASVLPKETARGRHPQSSQALLAHYAKLNQIVFPKMQKARTAGVEDV